MVWSALTPFIRSRLLYLSWGLASRLKSEIGLTVRTCRLWTMLTLRSNKEHVSSAPLVVEGSRRCRFRTMPCHASTQDASPTCLERIGSVNSLGKNKLIAPSSFTSLLLRPSHSSALGAAEEKDETSPQGFPPQGGCATGGECPSLPQVYWMHLLLRS